MLLSPSEIASAERTAKLYDASTSPVKVKRKREVSADQEFSAEQLMVRVVHRAFEKAARDAVAGTADINASQQSLIDALQQSSNQGTRPIGDGPWDRVLARDFGEIQYQVTVEKPLFLLFWDKSLNARVVAATLPESTMKIDVKSYANGLQA